MELPERRNATTRFLPSLVDNREATMRHFALLFMCLAGGLAAADEITLKNGKKFDGNVQGLKDGLLDVHVFATYVAGHPAYKSEKVRFSNVRSISFDGRNDYFSIVRKNDDLSFGHIRDLSRGKFTVEGSDPIAASSVKALVPSKPNAEEEK
jgi:hypothetical protein